MLLVTGGGVYSSSTYVRSTEVLVLPGGRWREAGHLPSGRFGLRGASLHGVLHVTGGVVEDTLTRSGEILSWDAVSEEWGEAGRMVEAREWHAVTEIPLSTVTSLCSVPWV